MPHEIKFYVALDLGSESMAAYYENRRTGARGMVQLQAHARTMLGLLAEPELLMENGKPSPRLRTRIGLEGGRQPQKLPEEHALLEFVDRDGNRLPSYEDSLFSYFYPPDQTFARLILPNPKIPFQEGGADIIPKVDVVDAPQPVQYPPDQLLAHLTVQVLRNLVLNSPELRDVDPEEVHLVLTVPNVYSLVHVQDLLSFIRKHVQVGRLEHLFESDAVAYLFTEAPQGDDAPEVQDFKNRILNRQNQNLLRLVTIDIGRGTTDLSLVQIEEPDSAKYPAGQPDAEAGSRRHFVLARTGKSDGGNRLSYLFAEYYNEVIRRVFAEQMKEPPFDLLEGKGSVGAEQAPALAALERLIDEVKKSITSDYCVSLSSEVQREKIQPLVDRLLEGLDPNWGTGSPLSEPGLPDLAAALINALLLPRRLPGSLKSWLLSIPWIKSGLKTLQGASVQWRHERLVKLVRDMESYVEANVVRLIDELEAMARHREEIGPRKKVLDSACTFVVVAGQASQFGPIAVAIRDHLGKKYDLPQENLRLLQSFEAKEACCRGAVHFLRSLDVRMNPEELHGIYGFLATVATSRDNIFRAADMAEIRSGGACTVAFNANSEYWLVFSPRVEIGPDRFPKRHDGTTAVIRTFEGSRFDLRYDPEDLSLDVNGQKVRVLATYGNIDDSIYPKIWPEVLKSTQD